MQALARVGVDVRDPKGGPRDGWSTSPRVAEAVADVLGPVFDPCWNPRAVIRVATLPTGSPARREQGDRDADDIDPDPWPQISRYVNPPFSQAATWVERTIAEAKAARFTSTIMLTLDDASVSWYGQIWRNAVAICRPGSRESFIPPPGIEPSSFNAGICLTLLSDSFAVRTAFMRRFRELGPVVTQWRI